jgi:hypothetical protein
MQGDLTNWEGFKGNIDACKQECNKMENCYGFMHNQVDTCWLKNDKVTDPVYFKDRDSYYKNIKPQSLDSFMDYKLHKNTDYPGQGDLTMDYRGITGDIDTCKKECNKTHLCHGFVHENNICWLKSNDVKTPVISTRDYYYKVINPSAYVQKLNHKAYNNDYNDELDKFENITPKECSIKCNEEKKCKAFVYHKNQKNCELFPANADIIPHNDTADTYVLN